MSGTGDLCAVNAKTGKVLWKKKLGIEQRQSSPFYANGLLYVAMYISAGDADSAERREAGTMGELFVIKPGTEGCEIVSQTQLNGRCFGSPIGYNGKIYIQTDSQTLLLRQSGRTIPDCRRRLEEKPWPKAGAVAKLQVIPSEVLLKPGDKTSFRVRVARRERPDRGGEDRSEVREVGAATFRRRRW